MIKHLLIRGCLMSILVGNPEHEKELMEKLLQYSRDQNWIRDNYSRLFDQHPMKYIAVKNQEVHHVADSLKGLISKIIRSGNIPGNYAIDFLTDEKCNYLF